MLLSLAGSACNRHVPILKSVGTKWSPLCAAPSLGCVEFANLADAGSRFDVPALRDVQTSNYVDYVP